MANASVLSLPERLDISRPIPHRTPRQILKSLTSFPDLEYAFGFVVRNVDADFRHHLYCQRIQSARLKPCALRVEAIASVVFKKSLAHLAARRIVQANK